MDHATVQTWLDRYIDAWRTYDEQAIGDLFSEDATYRYHRWDEPVRGREAIVKDWLANPDAPGTWSARYAPYVVEDAKAVAVGTSSYKDATTDSVFHNVFLLEFAPDGRVDSFEEVYAKER